eukprot:gnl/TRDRNA2_/TRDRNA2_147849_c2_seq1.p1 gnl/TRDRNA2_/TRDRNA2_147849_c2~~gnl/TRDRNA2_/TRDRNA2_147849_c2_seq1.p1  ORF type:complete len:247 (+),score=29.47 gnl/TRDRNA2_/TRDRNA2_147849_c2_seq1:84-743(+)
MAGTQSAPQRRIVPAVKAPLDGEKVDPSRSASTVQKQKSSSQPAQPAVAYFDATNCADTIAVRADGLAASWGEEWGGVAVRSMDGSIPKAVRLCCTSVCQDGDISVGVASASVADLRAKARPHGEIGGWLIRGCFRNTEDGSLKRTCFEHWPEGACRLIDVLLEPNADVEVHWNGCELVWLEDSGSGRLEEQTRLSCGPAEIDCLYCWAFPGASVELRG